MNYSKCSRFLLIICVITFNFLILTTPGFSATLQVCKSGCAYTTISSAITAAQSGDIVTVLPSAPGQATIYEETIILNKNITLRASEYDALNPRNNPVIIDGPGSSAPTITVPSNVSGMPQIIGFHLRDGDSLILTNSVVNVEYNFFNGVFAGSDLMEFEGGSGGYNRYNIFDGADDDAIDMDNQVKDVTIEHNQITNSSQDGIEIRLQDDSIASTVTYTIRQNRFQNNGAGSNGDGIQIIDYYNDTNRRFIIDRNLFIDQKKGAAIGLMCCEQTNVSVTSYDSSSYTFSQTREEIRVTNNTFVRNAYGIAGGANMLVLNNLFVDTGYPVGGTRTLGAAIKKVSGSSRVSHNIFWNNYLNYVESNIDTSKSWVANPLFSSDYQLSSTSPAIDAGINSYGWTNIFGTFIQFSISSSNYSGAFPDLGWWESGYSAPPISPTTTLTPFLSITQSPSVTTVPAVTPSATPTNAAGTSQIRLIAIADAFVSSDTTGTNYGSSDPLEIDAETDGSPTEIAYIQFNLSSLVADNIRKATLALNVTNLSTNTQSIRHVNTTWSENAITFTNRPAASSLVTTTTLNQLGIINVDVTAWAKTHAGAIVSLLIDQSGTDGADFNSKENPTDSLRPTLVIDLNSTPENSTDLDADNDVDFLDLLKFMQQFTKSMLPSDFNLNSFTDIFDWNHMIRSFRLTFTPTPTAVSSNPTITSPSSTPSAPTPTFGTSTPLRAFPQAQGYGANSTGGRGGRVIEVTNLQDSGTGSLRDCINATGNRVCVFRIAGTISVASPLYISNGNIRIAGQTAPGGGITLKNAASNDGETVRIGNEASGIRPQNVTIQYIRSRPGPTTTNVCCVSAFRILGGSNIILDHVSASWAVDENMTNWYSQSKVTVSWSIISEALSNSSHYEGEHSKGHLIGEGVKEISVHHNLFSHNYDRNPWSKHDTSAEIVNNIIYNWVGGSTTLGNSSGTAPSYYNLIGNDYLRGANTSSSAYGVQIYSSAHPSTRVYLLGNTGPGRTTDSGDEWLIVNNGLSLKNIFASSTPAIPLSGITFFPSNTLKSNILPSVGASIGLDALGQPFSRRDAVDKRIVAQVTERIETGVNVGTIIDCPSATTLTGCSTKRYPTSSDYSRYNITDPIDNAGWPILDPGSLYADTDNDGMSDQWELHYFGNLFRGSATNSSSDYDGDGYTDLEEFLNITNPLQPT